MTEFTQISRNGAAGIHEKSFELTNLFFVI